MTSTFTPRENAAGRLCYMSRNYYSLTSAGNKAKTDNEDTLQAMGAVNIGLSRTVRHSKVRAFFLDLAGVLRACLRLRRGDVLFLQYPVKKYFTFLCRMARWKGAQTLCVVHDLGSFRRRRLTVRKEIGRLSHCSYVIASNRSMAAWLAGNGLSSPVGALGLFDYRSPSTPQQEMPPMEEGLTVVYAGALNPRKNGFFAPLSEELKGWRLVVCGKKEGLQGLRENPLLTCRGYVPSEEFIRSAGAHFGLVWDGESTQTCSGSFGEYLRLNSPHKVSFYLRAGLPVVVWKEAAVAPLVESLGVGLAVSSLSQLAGLLESLTPDRVRSMRQNALLLSRRLDRGQFLREAIEKALHELRNPTPRP